MDVQKIINSRLGAAMGFGLARIIPARTGKRLARKIGSLIASQQTWPMVQAVRANQWVVSGGNIKGNELQRVVRETYQNNAQAIFELYRGLAEPETLAGKLVNPEKLIETLEYARSGKKGVLALGVHLSNFDLLLLSALQLVQKRSDLRGIAIGAPQPGGGYQWQNRYRQTERFEIIPASVGAMRIGIETLNSGNFVLTGVDRPAPADAKLKPRFFGRPSSLPTEYIFLALKTGARVLVFGGIPASDATYQVIVSEPIEMKGFPNRDETLLYNAEAVLNEAASLIRLAPLHWAMPYPVWPDVTPAMIE